jgi:hypothetical protein
MFYLSHFLRLHRLYSTIQVSLYIRGSLEHLRYKHE